VNIDVGQAASGQYSAGNAEALCLQGDAADPEHIRVIHKLATMDACAALRVQHPFATLRATTD